jgi:Xaa-Pro aminopeptidase
MLDPALSRQRQRRLLDHMTRARLDAVVVGWPGHVYYLGAHFTGWLHQSAFVLSSDGRSWMTTANSPASNVAADDVFGYEAQWHATQRLEQPQVVGQMVADVLKSRRAARVGIDASPVTLQVALHTDANTKLEAIDPVLWQLRRVKDPDELVLMKQAVRCTEAMYGRAKQIIEPETPELRVFAELHQAAVETAGEPMTALLGNDYRCGEPGGPARGGHVAGDGQIYILDLGPCFRGYFADNCRAFAVNRKPTDAQMQTWKAIVSVLDLVEKMAKPGVRCRDLYRAADEHLTLMRGTGMSHHLGHGVGLQPHEFPHLNPKWDDVLLEGEVFTAEPGLYSAELNGGIRIENQYLVTKNGVENLLNFPQDLT